MAKSEKSRRVLHPAVSILSWLLFALAVELASPSQLVWLVLPAGLLLADKESQGCFARLVWKARWLWFALVLIYAWTIPGTLVFPNDYSPTHEGIEAGLLRVGRLLMLLAALSRLLSEFSSLELAGGIYVLARPLAWVGLEPRALAVRLALTFEHLEHLPERNKWLEQLRTPIEPQAGPDEIRLFLPAIGIRDTLILLAAMAMLGMVLI